MERKELAKRKRIENLTEALTNNEIENNPYILEQLFQDRYGALLDYKEIKYFLKQENPSWLISQYIKARALLKFNDTYTHLIPRGFFFEKRLRFILWPSSILFTLSAMLGILGIVVCFILIFEASDTKSIIQTAGVSIISFLYAWVFSLGSDSAESAMRLKHITRRSKQAKLAPGDAVNGAT